MGRGTKRCGKQQCDACGRDFVVDRDDMDNAARWNCPHCGFDNRAGEEWAKAASRAAARKAKQAAEERREYRGCKIKFRELDE